MGGQVKPSETSLRKRVFAFQYRAAEIQIKHNRMVLDYRGQDRIIRSDVFVEAWNRASENERKYVLGLFSEPDAYKLKRWILKIMVGGLEQYPISVLRQIASYHQIKNYSRMSKACLLNVLTMKGVTDGSKNI